MKMPDRCCIPGCGEPCLTHFNLRARYEDTNAAWGPNLYGGLCEAHTFSGVNVTLVVEPAKHGRVDSKVVGSPPTWDARSDYRIKQP